MQPVLADEETTSTPYEPRPAAPVTLRSLTLCLAFLHYCTPIPPRRGRGYLRPLDARRLADWLGLPPTSSQKPAHDLALAAHLTLLAAAGLIAPGVNGLRPVECTPAWLRQPEEQQVADLLAAGEEAIWTAAASSLGLRRNIPIDYMTYFLQVLASQARRPAARGPAAFWLPCAPGAWRLRLRLDAPPYLLFQLLGLGDFEPPDQLRCDPLSLGSRRARDLGPQRLRHLLETATESPLSREQQHELAAWQARGRAYRLLGPVLVTTQAHHLDDLYAARCLRPYLLEQLSPRCVLFDRAGTSTLQRWLGKRGFPLDAEAGAEPVAPLDARTVWLGLRLLTGLQRYAHLPTPPPYETLDLLEEVLGEEATTLEAVAERMLADLDEAMQGRDRFMPAARPVELEMVDRLREAIAAERALTLLYEALGSAQPRWHTVEPLRLETRGTLIYLHAYSLRTESNLTFRLDRIKSCGPPQG